jgi:hypothetical protein
MFKHLSKIALAAPVAAVLFMAAVPSAAIAAEEDRYGEFNNPIRSVDRDDRHRHRDLRRSGPNPREISRRIDRIAYQVEDIRDIRGPRRKLTKIDRLQARLARLEAITEHQRGRRARRNDHRIDRLQHRLRRIEHRIERRVEARRYDNGHRGRVVFDGFVRRN